MDAGELLAGRYRLELPIGSGGMGRVWRAHDLKLDRAVAVKTLTHQRDGEAKARFVREARATARLSHPNIAAVHDADEESGQAYLVMELVEGLSYDQVLRDRGRLTITEVHTVGEQVAAACAAAHAAGIVHRDLKPANLLRGTDGRIRVVDFGIARVLDDAATRLTRTGMMVGTPAYLAPEQIQDDTVTAASDIYALGCVLYELLCGRPPFTGGITTLMYGHVSVPPEPPSTHRSDVPAELDSLILTMLSKEPRLRPTADTVRRQLSRTPPSADTGLGSAGGESSRKTRDRPGDPGATRRVDDQPTERAGGWTRVLTSRHTRWAGERLSRATSALPPRPRPVTVACFGYLGFSLLGLLNAFTAGTGAAGFVLGVVNLTIAGFLFLLANWARIAATAVFTLYFLVAASQAQQAFGRVICVALIIGFALLLWLPPANRVFTSSGDQSTRSGSPSTG